MYKTTVSYTDFNGEAQSEELYFHLSKPEVAELQVSYPEGLDKHIDKVVQEENTKEMLDLFQKLVLQAYGRKSEDGKHFVKSPEEQHNFKQSAAYDEYLFRLMSDEKEMDAFVNGAIPEVPEAENAQNNRQTVAPK